MFNSWFKNGEALDLGDETRLLAVVAKLDGGKVVREMEDYQRYDRRWEEVCKWWLSLVKGMSSREREMKRGSEERDAIVVKIISSFEILNL